MIVDDEPANLRLLQRLFRRDYQVICAESGAEALSLLEQHDVALLITDQRMSGMTGIELLERTARLRPATVRIILTGYTDTQALVEAINCGQVYRFITKPWNNDDLRSTVARALQHYEESRSRFELARINERLARNLQEMTHAFVRAIGDALDAKDDYAQGHARRTQGFALAIGRRLCLEPESLEHLSLAAFLHDIGRIGTPDALLLKPGALTTEERHIMQQHSERGARLLAGVPGMAEVAVAVRHHHEHFDGSGYPRGISGYQIPQLSRIILVADAYDALTCPRPFREAHTHEQAIRILRDGSGKSFDSEIVNAFCELESLALIRRRITAADFSQPLAAGYEPAYARRLTQIQQQGFDELQVEVMTDPLLALNVLRAANKCEIEMPNEAAAATVQNSSQDSSQDLPTAHDDNNNNNNSDGDHATNDLTVATFALETNAAAVADLAAACRKLGVQGLRETIKQHFGITAVSNSQDDEPLVDNLLVNDESFAPNELATTTFNERIAVGEYAAYVSSESTNRFQERALRCATAARLLAEHTGVIDPADAYTLGLTHDVGLTLLRESFPRTMHELDKLDEDERIEKEVEHFGIDHAQVSEWMLERCHVPRTLAALTYAHHDVLRTSNPAALLLHVAARLAHADNANASLALDALASERFSALNLTRSVIATIYTRTAELTENQLAAYSLNAL